MNYHYFNPDHDIALAVNAPNYQPARAAREMRRDLAYLPALWAEDGDCVVVDDVSEAERLYRLAPVAVKPDVRFILMDDVPGAISDGDSIEPWGWDAALRMRLLHAGVAKSFLPSGGSLAAIRNLSSRWLAVEMLENLNDSPLTIGTSAVCETEESVRHFLQLNGHIVVKAPWSCSGRGIRFLSCDEADLPAGRQAAVWAWIRNVIAQQGSVIVEVMCRKVMDFAMEFHAHAHSVTTFRGLSLFTTNGSAYTGNLLMSGREKVDILTRYLPEHLLIDTIRRAEDFLTRRLSRHYSGPLGVDMMVALSSQGTPLLNPCVEINLRRTMGHLALSLSERGERGVMRIERSADRFMFALSAEG